MEGLPRLGFQNLAASRILKRRTLFQVKGSSVIRLNFLLPSKIAWLPRADVIPT